MNPKDIENPIAEEDFRAQIKMLKNCVKTMKHWIELTKPEIEHLNSLLSLNENYGCYYGSKMQYWNRHKRLCTKLDNISKDRYMFRSPKTK